MDHATIAAWARTKQGRTRQHHARAALQTATAWLAAPQPPTAAVSQAGVAPTETPV